jgi:Na+/H+-dicarboxylate symporter
LEAAWRPHRVRFLSNASGEYTVAFGSASVTGRGPTIPPGIEKNNTAAALLTLPETVNTISGDSALTVKPKLETTKKFVLWVVLSLVLVVMGYMTFRLMKHMKHPDH